MVPNDRKYSKEHEWVLLNGKKAKVGITHHAQDQLGDIVFVELPKKGSTVEQMKTCGVIESVKAVSDLYSPVTGTVIEINSDLSDHPEKVNQDPYNNGWIFVAETDGSEIKNLMSAEEYENFIGTKV